MKKGINLAHERKKNNILLQKIQLGLLGIFAVCVVIAAVIIGYRLMLGAQLDNLAAQENSLIAQNDKLKDRRDKFMAIKDRLSTISTLIAKRTSILPKIDTVSSALPQGVTLSSISGDNKKLSVQLSSDQISLFNDLLEQRIIKTASDKKKGVKQINMTYYTLNLRKLLYSAGFEITF